MAEKYKNKYRVPSARAVWWDYGNCAPYFITICTKNKEHFFGVIDDGEIAIVDVDSATVRAHP